MDATRKNNVMRALGAELDRLAVIRQQEGVYHFDRTDGTTDLLVSSAEGRFKVVWCEGRDIDTNGAIRCYCEPGDDIIEWALNTECHLPNRSELGDIAEAIAEEAWPQRKTAAMSRTVQMVCSNQYFTYKPNREKLFEQEATSPEAVTLEAESHAHRLHWLAAQYTPAYLAIVLQRNKKTRKALGRVLDVLTQELA